jgi:hypothetical protein
MTRANIAVARFIQVAAVRIQSDSIQDGDAR